MHGVTFHFVSDLVARATFLFLLCKQVNQLLNILSALGSEYLTPKIWIHPKCRLFSVWYSDERLSIWSMVTTTSFNFFVF